MSLHEHMVVSATLDLKHVKGVSVALSDIVTERASQIEQGYTPEHDDTHDRGEIGAAAIAYSIAAIEMIHHGLRHPEQLPPTNGLGGSLRWPDWQWRPATARAMLIKSVALSIAEIERIDRAAAKQGGAS